MSIKDWYIYCILLGVLAQENTYDSWQGLGDTFIRDTYFHFVQQAGARAVPVRSGFEGHLRLDVKVIWSLDELLIYYIMIKPARLFSILRDACQNHLITKFYEKYIPNIWIPYGIPSLYNHMESTYVHSLFYSFFL